MEHAGARFSVHDPTDVAILDRGWARDARQPEWLESNFVLSRTVLRVHRVGAPPRHAALYDLAEIATIDEIDLSEAARATARVSMTDGKVFHVSVTDEFLDAIVAALAHVEPEIEEPPVPVTIVPMDDPEPEPPFAIEPTDAASDELVSAEPVVEFVDVASLVEHVQPTAVEEPLPPVDVASLIPTDAEIITAPEPEPGPEPADLDEGPPVEELPPIDVASLVPAEEEAHLAPIPPLADFELPATAAEPEPPVVEAPADALADDIDADVIAVSELVDQFHRELSTDPTDELPSATTHAPTDEVPPVHAEPTPEQYEAGDAQHDLPLAEVIDLEPSEDETEDATADAHEATSDETTDELVEPVEEEIEPVTVADLVAEHDEHDEHDEHGPEHSDVDDVETAIEHEPEAAPEDVDEHHDTEAEAASTDSIEGVALPVVSVADLLSDDQAPADENPADELEERRPIFGSAAVIGAMRDVDAPIAPTQPATDGERRRPRMLAIAGIAALVIAVGLIASLVTASTQGTKTTGYSQQKVDAMVTAARKQGYTQGEAAGKTAGASTGKSSGYSAGQAAGYASGKADGYSAGKADGYSAGQAAGQAAGYAQGKTDGYNSGKTDGFAAGQAAGIKTGQAQGETAGCKTVFTNLQSDRVQSDKFFMTEDQCP